MMDRTGRREAINRGAMGGVLASMAAFVKAGVRPKTAFARRIVAALVFKACAVAVLWFVFFAPANRPVVTDAGVERVLLGPAGQPRQGEAFHE